MCYKIWGGVHLPVRGALLTFPYKLRLKFFLRPPPGAPPGYATVMYHRHQSRHTVEIYASAVIEFLYTYDQGRINHSGGIPNLRRGSLLIRVPRILSIGLRCTFSAKKLTTFLDVVSSSLRLSLHCTFKRQHSVVKIWQLIGGVAVGDPPMVQPAQWIIRPCVRPWSLTLKTFSAMTNINCVTSFIEIPPLHTDTPCYVKWVLTGGRMAGKHNSSATYCWRRHKELTRLIIARMSCKINTTAM